MSAPAKQPRAQLEFCLNGERIALASVDASQTVLTWLRERRGLVGTKEGCAEGDCGACTAVLAEATPTGELRHLPVNTCILCLGALDGRELITVEGLKPAGKALHPVQQAMVDCHGSQCGFCTPGFVMSLYAHGKSGGGTDRESLCDALAGNLCRCTGYRPILEAGQRAPALADANRDAEEDKARMARIAALPADAVMIEVNGRRFYIPRTADDLAKYLSSHAGATLLGGGTDLGLLITKAHRDLDDVAYTGRIDEMRSVESSDSEIMIGGAATYFDAGDALASLHPDMAELVRRLGSMQVRASGTLAGNIANGSPIGDTMPPLLALGATLVLQRGASIRDVALEDFYTGYRKTVLASGEFIRSVRIPKLAPRDRFAVYKLSKRFDQDISSVCAAFRIAADGGAKFGFGGMAATPSRAKRAEAAWPEGVEAACSALAEDFAPLSDQRASSWYRLSAAQNLLRKFAMELEGKVATRLLEVAS
jgi:xanthine dehydrogenase small subunit